MQTTTKTASQLRPYDRFRYDGRSFSVDGLRFGSVPGNVEVVARDLSEVDPRVAVETLSLRLGAPLEMLAADRADDLERLRNEVEALTTGILQALDNFDYALPDVARIRNALLVASASIGDEDAEARAILFGAL